MTETIRNKHARTLCTLAQEDEFTLSFPLPDQIFGFHAQQSCEKLLKALLYSTGRNYPFTHSLAELTTLLAAVGEPLPRTPYDLIDLEPFAVELRYDIGEPIPGDDRLSIRESVAILRDFTLARILELERTSTP